MIEYLIDFNHKFNVPIPFFATVLSEDDTKKQIKLLREEVDELEKALANRDLENILKELTDIRYVLYQTIVMSGMDFVADEAYYLVHENNMSKVDENGNPIYNEFGKVMKPPNYKPVDLSHLIIRV